MHRECRPANLIPGLLFPVLLLFPTTTHGQTSVSDLAAWAQVRKSPTRRALVIGVSAYDKATQLPTPYYDAQMIAAKFQSLSFSTVSTLPQPTNSAEGHTSLRLDRKGLIAAIDNFAASLREGDIAVVYFSGHGVQRDGVNYLVPSDAEIDPEYPGHSYLSLDYLISKLEEARVAVAVVILDACRADPFVGTDEETRDLLRLAAADDLPEPQLSQADAGADAAMIETRTPAQPASSQSERPAPSAGLARLDGPPSILIAYAASPDRPAFSRFLGDPASYGSIYTRRLAERLTGLPPLPLDSQIGLVERDVDRLTDSAQRPFHSEFGPPEVMLAPGSADRTPVIEHWVLVNRQSTPGQLATFLDEFLALYPTSDFAFAARQRLAELAQQDIVPEVPGQRGAANSPTYQFLGSLQILSQDAEGGAIATLNRDIPLRKNWGTVFKSQRIGELHAGQQVRVLKPVGNDAAWIMTQDGQTGYVGDLTLLTASDVKANITVRFSGSDEMASVDLTPLAQHSARLAQAGTSVAIRTGPAADAGNSRSRAISMLRSLRLRAHLLDQGVPAEAITITSNLPTVPADSAEVLISSAEP